MLEKLKKYIIPAIILALVYNLLPLLMADTGSAMMILLILLPIVTFAVSALAGWRAGFCWVFPVLAAVLFLPAIFLYMNASAWVYAPGFGVLALVGMWIGNLVRQ